MSLTDSIFPKGKDQFYHLAIITCVVVIMALIRCAMRVLHAAPTVNGGLDKNILRRLPKLIYDGGEITDCSICLDEFVAGDELQVLQCGHRFHLGCTDMWLKSHSSCPLCRRDLWVDEGVV